MTDISSTPKPTPTPSNESTLFQIRKFLFVLLEYPHFTSYSKIVYQIILINILASILLTILLSNDEAHQFATKWIDLTFSIIFNIEFIIRICCCTVYGLPFSNYLQNPYFFVDLFSGLPFLLELYLFTPNKIHPIIRLLRIIPILKILRYLQGLEMVFKSVKSSIHQFWTVTVALFITIFGFGVTLYYSEISYSNENEFNSSNIYSLSDSMWLVIVTLTTTGYGDKSPKTIIGRIIASVLSFIGNSIILALPTAIIGLDFSKAYNEDQEQKKQEELNVKYLIKEGNEGESFKQVQLKYMYNRLNEIESRNKLLSRMLEQSNIVTRELTNQMENLLMKMGDEMGLHELVMIVKNRQIRDLRRPAQMGTKIKIFDKFMKAKQKIKISNLLRNMKKNTVNTNKIKQRSPSKKQTAQQIFVDATKKLIIQQNIIKLLQEMKSSQDKIQIIQRREPRFNSVGNENLILRKRNEELGHLAFEFMNDINSSEISASNSSDISSSKSDSHIDIAEFDEKHEEIVSFQNRKSQRDNLLNQSIMQNWDERNQIQSSQKLELYEQLFNSQKMQKKLKPSVIKKVEENQLDKKIKMATQNIIYQNKEINFEYQRNNLPSFISKSNQISKI